VPFETFVVADVTRLVLCVGSMFLVMVAVRLMYLRARAPRGSDLRDRSPWALLSYACWSLIPTVLALQSFGERLEPLTTIVFAAAVSSGLWAAFGQITIHLWARLDGDDADGEEASPQT
jgi:hypothetical protein